jgi:Dolichyl-phosphate-mannose-protein mannosyltransferase
LVATLLVGGVIFVNHILRGEAFTKEEAQHAQYAFWIYRDVITLDWAGFAYDTGRQMLWPFLHSWVLAIFYLLFGVSYVSARSLSFLFFFLSILMVYDLSNKMSEKSGWKIGIISCLLMLTSPLIIKYSALSMLESLGSFLFLCSAHLYINAEDRKDLLDYVLLAFLIGLSIYTNYIYAFLVIPAFMVGTIADLGPILKKAFELKCRGEKAAIHFIWWGYRKMVALFVILGLAAIWFSFSFSRKIILINQAILKYSGGTTVSSIWEALTYYPRVIIENVSFSPWLGIFILISLFLPFIASRYHGLKDLFTFVWTVLVLTTLALLTKSPRMIYIIVPFVFIIFSSVVVYFYDRLKDEKDHLAIMFVALLIIPSLFSIPGLVRNVFGAGPQRGMIAVLDYFKAEVPKESKVMIPFNLKHLNPEGAQFHFRENKGEVITDSLDVEDTPITDERYFLTVDLDPGSIYQADVIDDSLYRWNSWLWSQEMNGEVRFYSSRRFEAAGITAKIYKSILRGND